MTDRALTHPYAQPRSTVVLVYFAACNARIIRTSHGLPQPTRPLDSDYALLDQSLGRSATEVERRQFADHFEAAHA